MARQSDLPLLKRGLRALAAAALLCTAGAQAADKAGEVVIARGLATAHVAGAPARILGSGSQLYVGETVTTGPRSVALLKLGDGTRMTLRPETSFQVEEYSLSEAAPSAVFRLFKGGLRAVTGFLSKRNPNAVQLRTAVATIGIRGTEFDARLCGADCAEEARQRPAPAGRAGFIKGTVIAKSASGGARAVKAGGPVYSGDALVTGNDAYAVVLFRDRSRVTVMPNTEFRVDRLVYEEARPEEGEGFFSLVRGGLRAVSGAIGKYRRNAYQMRTAVATIGIRGTGYDLYCVGACVNPDPAARGGDGLYADVNDGAIDFDGNNPLSADQPPVFIGSTGMTPIEVPAMPVPIDVPMPDAIDVPPVVEPAAAAPGEALMVACYAGNCAVQTDQNTVELGAGDAARVGLGGGPAEQLPEIPAFQAEDVYFQAMGTAGENLNLIDSIISTETEQCD
ncbi:MAG: FecR domain-containing protein [Gammaproteobacteria bacterium]